MHRFRSWTLDPPEWRTQRNRLLPAEGGDGSTLSLDFTTGVLDPRLTFTRLSNATFINSIGLVEWAAANMVRNSQFSSSGGTPTSWTASVTGSGAVTSASGEVTCTVTTAGRAFIYEVAVPLAQGITYSVAFDLVVVAGSPKYSDLILATAGATTIGYYLNGVALPGANPTAQGNNTASSGRVTVVFTSGSGSLLRFGPGSQGADMTNVTVKFSRPSVSPGNFASPAYYESTNATTAYYAPRFDYDPTSIGTPRGLLIEGTATNYAPYSNALNGPGWNSGGSPTITPGGGAIAPDGIFNSTKFVLPPVAGGNVSRIYYATGYPATAYPYTVSVWMKSNTAQNYIISILGTGNTINTVTPVWQRFQVTVTSAATLYGYIYISNESTTVTADISMWGAQLEAGSGASSYIPTGASTATRNADVCYMDGTNFSSWYNSAEGSIYVEWTGGVYANNANGRSYTLLNSAQTHQIFEGSGSALNVYLNTFQAQIGTGVGSAGPSGRVAGAFKQDDFAVSFNGGAVSTDTSGNMPTAVDRLSIGSNYLNAASFKFASIKRIKYWPTRLPNATLQAITTL